MKFVGIICCIILILGLNSLALTARAQGTESITFSGTIHTVQPSFPHPHLIDTSHRYSIYAEAGAVLSFTLEAEGWCYCRQGGAGLLVDGVVVWDAELVSLPTASSVNFGDTFVFSYLVTETGYKRLTLGAGVSYTVFGFPHSIRLNYQLTISGVSQPPNGDEITEAELRAGLQRVAAETDLGLPIVIYVPTPRAAESGDRFINIWQLDEAGIGQFALTISADELLALPDFPSENLLLASAGYISVYKLTTGEYQVNVGPLADGKVHVVIFDGIPLLHAYGYTWEVARP